MFEHYHQNSEFQKIAEMLKTANPIAADIKQLILKNPNCLQQANSDKETLLHIAARYSNYDSFKAIVTALGTNFSHAALRLNKDGLLPVQCAAFNKRQDKKLIYKELEQESLKAPFKPINEPIDFKSLVLENIDHIKKNKYLLFKLHYAWIAASFARQCIHFSQTHMSANLISIDNLQVLIQKSFALENAMNECGKKFDSTSSSLSQESLDLIKLNEFSLLISKLATGNCIDYCTLVLKAFQLMGTSYYPVIYSLEQNTTDDKESTDTSDHVFVVLFDKNRTDGFKDWQNELVIDAWSGDIYFAPFIPNKLKDLKCFHDAASTREYNVTCPFDTSLHKIALDETFQFTEEFWKKNTINDFNNFANLPGIEENFRFIQDIWQQINQDSTPTLPFFP